MTIYKAPQRPSLQTRIFLAGSIEMGKAEDWQTRVTEDLSIYDNITILNPRRDDWDSSWLQTISNPKFKEQVDWELEMMEIADIIAMYFAPDTLSPISLLELGLHASSGKLVVYCPPLFWRKGNVDVVCERHGVPVFADYEQWISEIAWMHEITSGIMKK